ncbi:MAG: THUMP domain-containing protein [Schleiferiaceae bacterium]|nr:THUMP domain-containing protein [Schleiferiaceae bacterium]
MLDREFEIVAKTFAGLEQVLASEVQQLGGREVKVLVRSVSFVGDIGTVYKANLKLRTALSVLVKVKAFRTNTQQDYYQRLSKIAWEDLFDENKTFSISTYVGSNLFPNSMYAGQVAKDAIVDRFRAKVKTRPSVSKMSPDIKVNIHISNRNVISVSLDSSGMPLFKRGYRTQTGVAPMNEVLAAGMLQLTGWDKRMPLLDPMCGSGTLLIEAALWAGNIPPGIFRSEFAFKNWKGFDQDLYLKVKEGLLSRSSDPLAKLVGYDNDILTLQKAKENVENAALEDLIDLRKADFFGSRKEVDGRQWIIFNPPYNKRIGTEPDFYKRVGDTLKQNFPNSNVWFITADLEGIKSVGLRASRRIPMMNGDLDCRLVNYDIVEGKLKDR